MTKMLVRMALMFAAMIPVLAAGPAGSGAPVPTEGTMAPDFSLPNAEGKPTALKDFHGKWVVLYFYPKDFTGGCTLEAHNFQRDLAKFEQAGAAIVGVSVDTAESHKQFCAKEGLGFTLLSDTTGKVTAAYGSVMEYQGSKLAQRNTFLIDPQGTIAKVFTKVDPSKHSEEVLAAIQASKGSPAASPAGS